MTRPTDHHERAPTLDEIAAWQEETFVYFVRAGEFVKIGQSTRWKDRVNEMQVGSPYTIIPLLVLVGPPRLERELHKRFWTDHFRGEWFHMGPAIRRFIKDSLPKCVANKHVILKGPRPDPWDEVT